MSADLRTELCDGADSYINDPFIEMQWAEKASRKAEIHTNLILSSDTKSLKLCREQDVIYQKFRETFPILDVRNVTIEQLKGDAITKWREFCVLFQDVKDYNFGSLLRLRADESYSDENTVLVPQIIFFALEIARNLEGVNETFKEKIRTHRTHCFDSNQVAI